MIALLTALLGRLRDLLVALDGGEPWDWDDDDPLLSPRPDPRPVH